MVAAPIVLLALSKPFSFPFSLLLASQLCSGLLWCCFCICTTLLSLLGRVGRFAASAASAAAYAAEDGEGSPDAVPCVTEHKQNAELEVENGR